jgi:hypothetical protein
MLRPRTLPAGFIQPCLPTSTKRPPSGKGWLHEIKHDGFRVIARKDGKRARLYSRPGNDLTRRFPRIGPPQKCDLQHIQGTENMRALGRSSERPRGEQMRTLIGIAVVVAIGLTWSFAAMSKLVPVNTAEIMSQHTR